MKKILILIAGMATFMSLLAQVQITESQALQQVKSYRTLQIDTANFYIGNVDKLLNEDYCPLDSNIFSTNNWLHNHDDMWLVFADENPLASWQHNCHYYYIPKIIENENNHIPLIEVEGILPPLNMQLHIIEKNVERTSIRTNYINDYPGRDIEPLAFNPEASKTRVVIISNNLGYETVENWTACAFLFNVLTKKYLIPKDNIKLIMTDANVLLEDSLILSKDFDGDGLNENFIIPSFDSVMEYIASDPLCPNSTEHLFVFFIGPIVRYWQYDYTVFVLDQYLDTWDFNMAMNIAGERYKNSVICGNSASCFGSTSPNYIKTASCSEDETDQAPFSIAHYDFANYWISAIANLPVNPDGSNADFNRDGMITMREAFSSAYENTIYSPYMNYNPFLSTTNVLSTWNLAFNNIPKENELYIKDNMCDTGVKPGINQEIYWNSPDIWVRNDDDGFYYKENDHLLVGSDEQLYIYVRVNNRGYCNYVDPSKYLHLYWKENSLNMSRDAIFGTGSQYGGKITGLSLDTAIAVDTSCIYRYVWQLPSVLVSRAASNGSILDIEVLALVNDSTTSVVPEDAGGMIALRENSNVAMRKENTILPSLGVYIDGGGMMVYQAKRVVKIPIYVNAVDNDAISKITLVSDSLSTGNSFSLCNYYLELSPGIYNLSSNLSRTNITTTNSAPEKYKLNAAGSSFEFKVPQNGVDSLIFYCEYNNRAPASDINHILHLKMTNSSDSIIDVETYTIKIDATGGTGPGIIMLNGNDGSCQLVATDISEPSRIEWFNPQDELIGESDTLCLNASRQQGEYTLRVASEKTGAVAYATAIIHDESAIESISPNPFNGQFTVRLSHPAVANTIIRLSPLSGNGRVTEYPVVTGEREVTISAENCLSGIYIVSLIENGKITGNSRIIKN